MPRSEIWKALKVGLKKKSEHLLTLHFTSQNQLELGIACLKFITQLCQKIWDQDLQNMLSRSCRSAGPEGVLHCKDLGGLLGFDRVGILIQHDID